MTAGSCLLESGALLLFFRAVPRQRSLSRQEPSLRHRPAYVGMIGCCPFCFCRAFQSEAALGLAANQLYFLQKLPGVITSQ